MKKIVLILLVATFMGGLVSAEGVQERIKNVYEVSVAENWSRDRLESEWQGVMAYVIQDVNTYMGYVREGNLLSITVEMLINTKMRDYTIVLKFGLDNGFVTREQYDSKLAILDRYKREAYSIIQANAGGL
jgi:hypothetical protein